MTTTKPGDDPEYMRHVREWNAKLPPARTAQEILQAMSDAHAAKHPRDKAGRFTRKPRRLRAVA